MHRNVFVLFLILTTSLFAQRKGAISTGGNLAFRSTTDQDSGYSYLNIEWGIGYYLSHNAVFEIEPSIQFDFGEKKVNQSSLLFGSLAYRLIDLSPDYQFRDARYRKKDLGIIAGMYASAGAGLWANGYSSLSHNTATYIGPALTVGLGTDSAVGKLTIIRIKAQFIHLYPRGPVFLQPRTIYQVSVGFRVFVNL